MHLLVRERDLRSLKREFARTLPLITHAQACEVLASGLGYRTFAALKAALKDGKAVHERDEDALGKRAQEIHGEENDFPKEHLRAAGYLLWRYRCPGLYAEDATKSIVASLAGWNGSPLTAFARDFDDAFWPEEGTTDGHTMYIGMRGNFSPLIRVDLFKDGVGGIPHPVMQCEPLEDSLDIHHMTYVIAYVERFARETLASVVWVGEMEKIMAGEGGTKPDLPTWLARSKYVDVTGFWGSKKIPAMLQSFH